MHLKKIHLQHYKNLDELDLDFVDGINCLVGKNGAGKTNVLDAIYFLSFTKSYTQPLDANVVLEGEETMTLNGIYERKEKEERVDIGVHKGQKKKVQRNLKPYKRLVEHIGEFPLTMISPTDRDLVVEGSETRRKFIDGVIGQTDRAYLKSLLSYNKALAQRNALLKYFAANRNFDSDSLAPYNLQLETFGTDIFQKRMEFLKQFQPLVLDYYKRIAEDSEEVNLVYQSNLIESEWKLLFETSLEKDRVLTYTSKGVHKDDIKFELRGQALKKMGSQGQQKSFLIALKLAQYQIIKDATGVKPILLLDDIFDKLDPYRVSALIDLVNKDFFGQIFISDTHEDRMESILSRLQGEHRIFKIDKGSAI